MKKPRMTRPVICPEPAQTRLSPSFEFEFEKGARVVPVSNTSSVPVDHLVPGMEMTQARAPITNSLLPSDFEDIIMPRFDIESYSRLLFWLVSQLAVHRITSLLSPFIVSYFVYWVICSVTVNCVAAVLV